MAEIAIMVSAALGAIGTIISAYLVSVARQTHQAVDGQLTELLRRVELLELVLSAEAEANAAREARSPAGRSGLPR